MKQLNREVTPCTHKEKNENERNAAALVKRNEIKHVTLKVTTEKITESTEWNYVQRSGGVE